MDSIIEVDGVGEIKVTRNKRSRQVRLKINHDGKAQVTAPPRIPLTVIKHFVSSKKDWIIKNQGQTTEIIEGLQVGREHVVMVYSAQKFSIKVLSGEIKVFLEPNQKLEDLDVQEKLQKKALECLRKECQSMLPPRVEYWASVGVGTYNNITIKLIRSRWGSYSSDGNMNLSLFMGQLPDSLIDYIIVHELSHSVHMNHSRDFWAHVEQYLPSYKSLKKQLKHYNMRVNAE